MDDTANQDSIAISVITATRNAAGHLPALIESLRKQTDRDFQWVVADGASTDGTLELLRSVADIDIVVSSQPDFGIYDALNRAIELSSGEYYIVCGADDYFYLDAIQRYRQAILRSHADIVSADYMYAAKRVSVKNGPDWMFGQSSYIAGHVLATAFRKDLHRRFGQYSTRFPIGGDQFFVLSACKGGASIARAGFVAGEMGVAGVSSIDRIGVALEMFRLQLSVGSSSLVQFPLLLLRLLRAMVEKLRP